MIELIFSICGVTSTSDKQIVAEIKAAGELSP